MEDTKTCPYCAETIRAEAVKCRFCGSRVDRGVFARSWFRRRQGRMIAGVCAGLAEEWGLSITLIRLAFVVATLVGGWGVVVYLVLWVIMPLEPEAHDRPPVSPPGGPERRW